MNPLAELVYKMSNSSLNYINNAIDYVISLEYYCSVKYEYTELRKDNTPVAIFILTSEECSSYITAAQHQTWIDAEKAGIPVHVIYKRKNTDELNVYNTTVTLTHNGSANQFGYLDNFTRIASYPTFMMSKNPKTLINSKKELSKKPTAVNAGFREELNELLLLVKL